MTDITDSRLREALNTLDWAVGGLNDERDALKAEVARLRLAIRYGACSSIHAAELREAGGAWAVDAIAERDGLQAANDRLRGLIREYFDAKYEYVSFRDAEKNRRYETAEDALASEAKEPKP